MAKPDVDNVGAGRAAKGAIPVDRERRYVFYTKAVGVSTPCREGSACGVSADSWTLLRYSVAMLFTTAHSPKHIISITNFNTFAV